GGQPDPRLWREAERQPRDVGELREVWTDDAAGGSGRRNGQDDAALGGTGLGNACAVSPTSPRPRALQSRVDLAAGAGAHLAENGRSAAVARAARGATDPVSGVAGPRTRRRRARSLAGGWSGGDLPRRALGRR